MKSTAASRLGYLRFNDVYVKKKITQLERVVGRLKKRADALQTDLDTKKPTTREQVGGGNEEPLEPHATAQVQAPPAIPKPTLDQQHRTFVRSADRPLVVMREQCFNDLVKPFRRLFRYREYWSEIVKKRTASNKDVNALKTSLAVEVDKLVGSMNQSSLISERHSTEGRSVAVDIIRTRLTDLDSNLTQLKRAKAKIDNEAMQMAQMVSRSKGGTGVDFRVNTDQLDTIMESMESVVTALNNQVQNIGSTSSSGQGTEMREMYNNLLRLQVQLKSNETDAQDDRELQVIDTHIKRVSVMLKDLEDYVKQRVNQYKAGFEAITANLPVELKGDNDYAESKERTQKRMDAEIQKILDYCSGEFSTMDVVMDMQFVFVYAMKVVRFGFIYLALFLAERIFENMYSTQVFTQNKDPPNLLIMLGIFLGIEAGMFVIIMIIIALVMYIWKTPDNSFLVDSSVLLRLLVDYAASTLMIFAIGAIVAHIIMRKKYFRYKLEGLRGIRAFQEVMIGISGIMTVIPFFMMVA